MYRLLTTALFILSFGCGSIASSAGDPDTWFGPPPENFSTEPSDIREFLGDDYLEHRNWIELDAWLDEMPIPRIKDPELLRYYYKCWYELWVNTQTPRDAWTSPIISPSITSYQRGIWLWDSAFHVLGLIHGKERAVALAKDQIRVMLDHQHPDGRIPREVWADGPRFFDLGVQAPGILPLAALEIYRVTGDWYFIEEVFESFEKNHQWFFNSTDQNHNQMFTWRGADSGWDASPRWDVPVEEALDLSCWMYLDSKCLADMASILGMEGKAGFYYNRSKNLASRIRQFMWDEPAGLFFDLGPGRKPTGIKSPASFFPMFAGIATPEQAARLVEHLKNSETFWTEYPVPSAAPDAPGFAPDRYWRGNVWINLNWIVIQGLRNYGYDDLADDLSARTLRLIMKHPVSYEYYNPLTGEGLGAKYYGWTASVLIRLCHELIERRTETTIDVEISESHSTILPPEDLLLLANVTNISESPLSNIRVSVASEFIPGGTRASFGVLPPGGLKGFVFRVSIPDRRGYTYFRYRVEADQESGPVVVERGRTLIMRDRIGSILSVPEGRRIGLKPFRVAVMVRNYRIQPMNGMLTLHVPEGWTVSPGGTQRFGFPFSNVRDDLSFTVTAPAEIPEGTYVLGSSLRFPHPRLSEAIEGGTVEVYRPARWMVIGPFDLPEEERLAAEYPPEKEIDLASQYEAGNGAVKWRAVDDEALAPNGYVDLLVPFPGEEYAVAYAATSIHSPTDTDSVLRVGSDDGIAVWVNGEKVLEANEFRGAEPDQDSAPVTLRAGWNPVLVKVSQKDRDWGFYFRITDEAGRKIPGLYGNPDRLRSQQAEEDESAEGG